MAQYRALPLRAHDFLDGVPIHDVWAIDLAGGPPGLTLQDCAWLIPAILDSKQPPIVRFLFWLREVLGKLFRWDQEESADTVPPESYIHKLTDEDRQRSIHTPGLYRSPQRLVYDFENEALGEIINNTVHAFVDVSLQAAENGYRLVVGIYVKPVGAITKFYMASINPFRHLFIYPTLINSVQRHWTRHYA